MFVPICNHFHAKQANSGKMTFWEGYFKNNLENKFKNRNNPLLLKSVKIKLT